MARKKLSAAKKAAKAAAAAAAGTTVEHHSSDNDSSAPESTSSKPELTSAVDASNKGKAVAEARSPAGNASINIEESKGEKKRQKDTILSPTLPANSSSRRSKTVPGPSYCCTY
jgi:hypothetical protein